MAYQLKELIAGIDVELKGNSTYQIDGVATIQSANAHQIAFLNNPHYRKFLATTQAGAIILSPEDAEHYSGNAIITKNPYYVYAKIASYFHKPPQAVPGIHATAVIGKNVKIHPSAAIGPFAVIGDAVEIGEHAVIGAHCSIGERCKIGAASKLDDRVTLYYGVTLGQRVHIASGAILGGDGFGFAMGQGAWHKVPQLGGVVVGDDVDIGVNTAIDRGALEATIIEDGVKLDNLIQVGHNVKIGAHTVIAGCVAIAGSTTIGKYCMIGGASCFAGHIEICDKAIITGMTAVTKSITQPGMYSSGIVGAVPNLEFRKNNAHFHRLPQLLERVKKLEALFKEKESRT